MAAFKSLNVGMEIKKLLKRLNFANSISKLPKTLVSICQLCSKAQAFVKVHRYLSIFSNLSAIPLETEVHWKFDSSERGQTSLNFHRCSRYGAVLELAVRKGKYKGKRPTICCVDADRYLWEDAASRQSPSLIRAERYEGVECGTSLLR